MNIFRVHDNPRIAAMHLCDKHVVKMILETAQVLSAAHHTAESRHMDKVYKVTHKNHPCTRWVRESKDNYLWTLEHLKVYYESIRIGTQRHKSGALLPYLSQVPNLPDVGQTEPPQAMYDCRL